MKPSKNPLFVRVIAVASVTACVLGSALAASIDWTGATNGIWSLGSNWSSGTAPGAADVANFTFPTTALTIKLDGNQTVLGLSTPAAGTANVHTLIGDGTDRTLTIGASGISHLSGGLTIGSGTAGQKVDIILSDGQTWNASRASGSGNAQALFINNSVTLGAGLGTKTLELTGINTGSYITGAIGNAAGSTLNVVKNGTGVWLLNGVNTYSGTTQINAGTLRLGAASVAPSTITVASGATLGFRVSTGASGMTTAEIDAYLAGANFNAGSLAAFDTASGSATYSGNYNSPMKLVKTGGNYLTLTGTNNASGGVTVSEGGLILPNPTTLSGNVSVAALASIVVRAGGSGFTAAEINAFRTSPNLTLAGTSYFGIGTANGDFRYGLVLPDTSTTRFSKLDGNTLFLTAQNTYTGGTQIVGGILSVSDIKNGGLTSQLGASSNVVNGLILAGGRLQYTGAGATTDRLFNLTGTSAIESSGTGALIFNNTGTISAEGGARNLILTGYNKADNRLAMNLANVTTGTAITSVIKTGSGKWILSGNNTHTGTTTIRGGTLTLDYSGGKSPIAATGQVVIQNGTAEFLGSGAKTVNSVSLSEGENGFGIMKITGGMALTATTLTSGTPSQRHLLIDTVGTGNSLTVTNLGPNITRGSNNLLLSNAQRANIVLRANDGSYGFAALTGTALDKLTGQTAATANSSNVSTKTVNYLYTAGNYTTSATLDYQTLTFDSSGGAINLVTSAGHNFGSSDLGRGLLFTGDKTVTISGTGGAIGQSTWIHNYLEGADLNISSSFGSNSYLIVGGTGFTNYTGTGLAAGSSGQFVLNGGLFRYAPTAPVTLNAALHRINSAVFEIGANLNGGGAVDLARTTGDFNLTGDAGFSASGGERKVSLGSTVTWGASNFLTTTVGDDGDFTFRLSSSRSDSTIDFQSKIDLNGKSRTVEVANGSAAVDARLSGGLTGSGIASRFVKTGSGTLELIGTNDYMGTTRVEGGRLLVSGGGLTATTAIHVANATLGLSGSEVINNSADITLENGIITTGGNQTETMGRLILIGDNQLDLVGLANVIRMASSADQTWSSTLSIVNWNGNAAGGGPDQFFIGMDQTGVTSGQLGKISFLNPEVDGVAYSGSFAASILTTGEIVAMIPEPSITLLLAGASLGMALRRRRI